METLVYLILAISILYLFGGIILWFGQNKLIYLPDPLPNNFAFSFQTDFEEFTFNSPTGNNLNCLLFKTQLSCKGIVLYHHGNSHNLSLWGYEAESFLKNGYNVLMYDYPTYGKSTGSLEIKLLFKDAKHLYSSIESYPRVINYGRSLGTGIALHLASQTPSISSTILETPYFSMKKMAETFVSIYPLQLLLRQRIKSYQYIKKVKGTVCIFHGTDDELIPHKQAVLLAKQNKNCKLYTIEGATHNDIPLHQSYQETLDLLLR
ncbi:alpha/beta hydrolase [Cyclobacteriaceae bacterium]|nr:alpha/beta hydrolase [Cyclobacteriaceae bacterium]